MLGYVHRPTTRHDLASVIPDKKKEKTRETRKMQICNCRNFCGPKFFELIKSVMPFFLYKMLLAKWFLLKSTLVVDNDTTVHDVRTYTVALQFPQS